MSRDADAFLVAAGWMLYAHGDFEEARRRAWRAIELRPEGHVAELAAMLLIEAAIADRQLDAILPLAEALAGLGGQSGEAVIPGIPAYPAWALRLERAMDVAHADPELGAELLLAWLVEFPNARDADLALHLAAKKLEEVGQPERAAALHARYLREYPEGTFHEDASEALQRLAASAP